MGLDVTFHDVTAIEISGKKGGNGGSEWREVKFNLSDGSEVIVYAYPTTICGDMKIRVEGK